MSDLGLQLFPLGTMHFYVHIDTLSTVYNLVDLFEATLFDQAYAQPQSQHVFVTLLAARFICNRSNLMAK